MTIFYSPIQIWPLKQAAMIGELKCLKGREKEKIWR